MARTTIRKFKSLCAQLRDSERACRANPNAENLAARDGLLNEAVEIFAATDRRSARYAKPAALTGQARLIDLLHDESEAFAFDPSEWVEFLDLATPTTLATARLYGLSWDNSLEPILLKCLQSEVWCASLGTKDYLAYFRWRQHSATILEALGRNGEIAKPLAALFRISVDSDYLKASVHSRSQFVRGHVFITHAYFLAGLRIPPALVLDSDPAYKASNDFIIKQSSQHGRLELHAQIGCNLEAYLRCLATGPAYVPAN